LELKTIRPLVLMQWSRGYKKEKDRAHFLRLFFF
jgi:hypothetical protein